MFQSLDVFRISQAMAQHAAKRQAVIASNIAHADTPGYAARDISAFDPMLEQGAARPGVLKTRETHLNGDFASQVAYVEQKTRAQSSPNGNSVSLEEEMVKATEAQRQHDRALAIYKNAMGILRTTLGRR